MRRPAQCGAVVHRSGPAEPPTVDTSSRAPTAHRPRRQEAPVTAVTALRTQSLVREFRGFRAVDGVDLDVAEGPCTPWWARTAPARPPCSTCSPASCPPAGRIELAGRDVTGLPPERVARLGVARSFQITSLFPQLGAREHVELALQGAGGWAGGSGARDGCCAASPSGPTSCWPGRARRPRRGPGRGARVRAQAGPGAGHRAGARPEGAAARRADRRHGAGGRRPHRRPDLPVRAGRTVVMVEHNMSVVGRLADRSPSCRPARCWSRAAYEQVRADERVITAYLGAADAAH